MPKPPDVDLFRHARYFRKNRFLHREDGPAAESVEGIKTWRIDGFKVKKVMPDGRTKYWDINDPIHKRYPKDKLP